MPTIPPLRSSETQAVTPWSAEALHARLEHGVRGPGRSSSAQLPCFRPVLRPRSPSRPWCASAHLRSVKPGVPQSAIANAQRVQTQSLVSFDLRQDRLGLLISHPSTSPLFPPHRPAFLAPEGVERISLRPEGHPRQTGREARSQAPLSLTARRPVARWGARQEALSAAAGGSSMSTERSTPWR